MGVPPRYGAELTDEQKRACDVLGIEHAKAGAIMYWLTFAGSFVAFERGDVLLTREEAQLAKDWGRYLQQRHPLTKPEAALLDKLRAPAPD